MFNSDRASAYGLELTEDATDRISAQRYYYSFKYRHLKSFFSVFAADSLPISFNLAFKGGIFSARNLYSYVA